MATEESPSCSVASGPTRTSEAAPFSDDTVRLFQLVCIYVKLVPGILHELFKHHYKDKWQVEWDDSAEKRTELAAEMDNEEVEPEFCYDEVKEKSITMWDVTTSCAALQVVGMADLPQYIRDVRGERNSLFHQTEAKMQLGRFGEIRDFVKHLIGKAGSILPKEFCDDCQKQLETLASTETFRKRFTNVKDVAELQEMLKRFMEDARKQSEQGEKFSEMLEALSKLEERLQVLQEVIEQGHAEIQRRQEHQLEVTEQGHAEIQRRQEHQLEVTEQGLADIQRVGETIQDQLQDLPSQPSQPQVCISDNDIGSSQFNIATKPSAGPIVVRGNKITGSSITIHVTAQQ